VNDDPIVCLAIVYFDFCCCPNMLAVCALVVGKG